MDIEHVAATTKGSYYAYSDTPYETFISMNYKNFSYCVLEKTITRPIVCLADKDQLTVPSPLLKLQLKNSGLGEKRVQFPVSAKSDGVKKVLHE